jgi:HAD superfamily hydrolase (TIGR01549 family)
MSDIKGILIDLDNTFYEYAPCHEHGFNQAFELLKKKAHFKTIEEFQEAYKKAQKRLKATTPNQAASHNRVLYFQLMLEDIGLFDPELVLELYEAYWKNFIAKMKLFDDFKDFLRTAKEKEIKIVVVTDLTAHIQQRKLINLELNDNIDFLVTSEEAGAEKPSPIMFELGLKKIGLAAHEVVFIGDNFDKDIEGANVLGIRPYWFQPDAKTELRQTDYYTVFSSYKDLINELF